MSIAAAGGITLGDVTAQTGDVALTSTATEVSPGSGALITTGTGPISVGAVNASGALTVAGLNVTATSLTANSTVDVEADAAARNTGASSQIDIGALEAGGAITLAANNGYASITNLTLDGTGASLNLTASGAVYLGYAPGGTGAGGGSGSVTGAGYISLTGGGDVDVDVPGALTLANVNATSTTANLTAGSLTIADVNAARGINLTAATGDLSVTDQATSVFGDNPINATSTTGSVSLNYAAGPNIYVTAANNAQVGSADNTRFGADDTTRVIQVTGASVTLGSAVSQNTVLATATNGSASVGPVTAGGDVTVSATNGSATLGDVTGQGGVSVTAEGGSATLHSATLSPAAGGTGFPNTVAVSATGTGADVLIGGLDSNGNLGFVTGATSVTAQADEDVTVDVGQAIALAQVQAGRNVSLTAPSLTLDSLQGALAGDLNVDVTGAGFSYASPFTMGGLVQIAANGDIQLSDVIAGGAIGMLASGSISTGDLTSGALSTGQGSIDLRAGLETANAPQPNLDATVAAGNLVAGDSIDIISAPGGVTVASATTSQAYESQGFIHILGSPTGPLEDAYGTGGTYTPPDPAFIDIGAVNAGSNVALHSGGLLSATGDITAGDYIDLQGDGVATQTLTANGASQGYGVSLQGLGGAVTVGDVTASAGSLSLEGASVNAGALTSAGQLSVVADTADAALGPLTSGAGIALNAPNGAITVSGDLAANGGDAVLQAGGDITLAGLSSASGNFSATATASDGQGGFIGLGAVAAGAVQAGGAITLAGSSVYASSLVAQGADTTGASITASAYDGPDGGNSGAAFVDIGTVAAPGDITLTASDGYASLTSANFTGPNAGAGQTLTLASTGTPQTVYLGYAQGGPAANDGAGPLGAQGGVTGSGAIELTSNGAVSADTTGALTLDQVNASGAVNITADAVSANAIYDNATDFGMNADGTTNVTARMGDVNLGTLEAIYGPVTVTAPGAVNAGIVVGQGVDISAGGLADINYVSTIISVSSDSGSYNQAYASTAPVQITGAQVTLNQGFGFGPFTLSATNGGATVGDLEFGGGAVSISAVNGVASLHSARPDGTDIDFTDQATLPTPQPSDISVTASGTGADVLIGGVSTAGRFPGLGLIEGAGSVTAQADEDVTVDVGQSIGLSQVSAGRNASITADALTLGTLTAGQDATLTTPNPATTQLAVTPILTANSVAAGEDLTIVAGDALSLGSVSAGRNLSLTGPSVSLAALSGQPSGAITVDATAGGFTDASPLSATGDVTATAAGALSLSDVTSVQGAVTLTGASVTAGALQSAADTNVTASAGDIGLASATTGGSLSIQALQGAVTVAGGLAAQGPAGGELDVDAQGAVMVGGPISAAGMMTLASATGDIDVTGPLYDDQIIQASAGDALNLGDLDVPNGYISLSAGQGLSFANAVAGSAFHATGGTVTGVSVDAPAEITLSGTGSVDLGAATSNGPIILSSTGGYVSLTNVSFPVAQGGSLNITTSGGGGDIYLGYGPGGAAQGGGSGAIAGTPYQIALNSAAGVYVDVASAANLDQVFAVGPVNVTADALSANTIDNSVGGPNGPITLLARTGDVDVGDLESFSPVTVTSTLGSVNLGFLAGQGIGVTAAGAANVSYASETGVTLDNDGNPQTAFYTSTQSIRITGAQVSLGLSNSYAGDIITATNGDATVEDIRFGGGPVIIQATNGVASLHSAAPLGSTSDFPPLGAGSPFPQPSASAISVSAAGAGADVVIGGPSEAAYIVTGDGGSHEVGGTGLGFIAGASSITLQAAQDVTANLAQPVELNSVVAGRNVSLTAPALTLDSLQGALAGDVAIAATSGGFIDTSPLTAGGAVSVAAAGPVTLSAVSAGGGDVSVTSQGAASVGDASASGNITVAADGGSANLHSATLTGGAGVLTVTASGARSDISLGQGTGFIQGAAQTNLQAGEDIAVAVRGPVALTSAQAGRDLTVTADGIQAGSLTSGRDTTLTSSAEVGASSVTAGEDLTVQATGAVVLGDGSVGRNLALTGQSISLAALTSGLAGDVAIDALGGDFTAQTSALAASPITAAGAIDISASGAIGVGALQANGGGVGLSGASVTTGAITAAGQVAATAGSGALSIASITTPAGSDLNGSGVSLGAAQLGGDLTLASAGSATLGSITVGGSLGLDAVGSASLGSVSVTGAGRITAGDLDIATLLSAPTLTIEARNGALTVGGSTAPTDGSMWISEAEFGRIRAPNSLDLYAGSTTGVARGALVVSDLSLDPTVTPKVSLYAAPGQTVSVTGAVTPTVSGGTLDIGSTVDAAWTPSTILVSGALGAATRVNDATFTGVQAFQQVTLSSGGDVLIGSPRFFALVQATPAKTIDIDFNQPSGVTATGAEVGHVYVATGQLNIDATGKVVQQNSSGSAGQYSGLYLLNGVSASKTALSIDPPSVVDLFGSFVNTLGVLADGTQAARSTGIQLLGLSGNGLVPSDYRFNGCTIDSIVACGVMVGPEQGFQFGSEIAQEYAGIAAATTDPQLLTQSVLLTIPPSADIEEEVDPLVTGVGNEEIWRKRKPTGGEASDR